VPSDIVLERIVHSDLGVSTVQPDPKSEIQRLLTTASQSGTDLRRFCGAAAWLKKKVTGFVLFGRTLLPFRASFGPMTKGGSSFLQYRIRELTRARRDSVCAMWRTSRSTWSTCSGRTANPQPDSMANLGCRQESGHQRHPRPGGVNQPDIHQLADRAVGVHQVTHDQSFGRLSLDQEQADPTLLQSLVKSCVFTACHRMLLHEAADDWLSETHHLIQSEVCEQGGILIVIEDQGPTRGH